MDISSACRPRVPTPHSVASAARLRNCGFWLRIVVFITPLVAAAEPPVVDPPVQRADAPRSFAPYQAALVQKHFAAAQQAQRASHHDEAARSYAIVHALQPRAEPLFLFAQCSFRAEHFGEALVAVRRTQPKDLQPQQRSEAATMETELLGIFADAAPNETQLLRTHLDAGKRAFQTQAFGLAMESYAVAYALKPLPRLLFNMAQAARRANQSQLALVLYRRLIAEEPNSAVRTESQGYVTELEQLIESAPLFRRPVFWGIVSAGVAAAALAVGLGVGLSQRDPTTDGGNVSFHFPALLSSSPLGARSR